MKKITNMAIVALLSIGSITGCASMNEASSQTASEVIAQAKEVTAQAKAANYEWRDTGKLIAKAEALLKAGDKDGALEFAKQALEQSRLALAQAKTEGAKFLDNN